jgi:energy-coupling factor transporter transmembrane protein EcfT
MQENKDLRVHPLYLFTMAAMGLVFILISRNILLSMSIYFLLLSIFFINGLSPKKYFRLVLLALLFSFGFFILAQLYPAETLKDVMIYQWGFLKFYKESLKHGLQQWGKLFLLTSLSMSSGLVIDYTKILMSLMQRGRMPLKLGYPLILAMNSIALLREEMNRIKMISLHRRLPFLMRVFPFFPLLVFAIRHSQRGALALVTRGLSDSKTFYFNYETNRYDRFLLLFFLIVYFSLVGLNFFVLK